MKIYEKPRNKQLEVHRQIQDQDLAKNFAEIKTKCTKKRQRPHPELGTCETFPMLAFRHLLFLTTGIPSWAKKHLSHLSMLKNTLLISEEVKKYTTQGLSRNRKRGERSDGRDSKHGREMSK